MSRILLIFFIALIIPSGMGFAQSHRDIKSVRREKQAVAAEVKKTDRAITDNNRATERNLNRLNTLQRLGIPAEPLFRSVWSSGAWPKAAMR